MLRADGGAGTDVAATLKHLPAWRSCLEVARHTAFFSTACAAACAGADGAQTQSANSTEAGIAFTRPCGSIMTWGKFSDRDRVLPPPDSSRRRCRRRTGSCTHALSCPQPKLVCNHFPNSRNNTRRCSVCGPGHPSGTLATMMAADLGSAIRQLIAQVELQGRAGGYATAEADLQQLRSMLQAWEAYRAKQAWRRLGRRCSTTHPPSTPPATLPSADTWHR